MWNEPCSEDLQSIPKLYETEHTPIEDKIVFEHFFIGGCDWYLIETDGNICFGFAILNGDLQNAEFGYFSLDELKAIKVGFVEVDRDLYWEVRPVKNVSTIMEARA